VSWQPSTVAAVVLDDNERRRYCRIIFTGCDTQLPPHRPVWSTFESLVSGHDSFSDSQLASWSAVRATSRPRNRRSNRTARRSQTRRRCGRATHVESSTLPRRYAGQRRYVRSRTQCARSTAGRTQASTQEGGRIMAERRRPRTGRGRRYWARGHARSSGENDRRADASLRAFVRALAWQAAREFFEQEQEQRSRPIQ
jgi:hypothetical protein